MADRDVAERYRAIDLHLRQNPIPALASATWIDDAIEVDGSSWPAVEMDWIAGRRLDGWIDSLFALPEDMARGRLLCMATRWRELALEVAAARVAHGDYQHGNILVDDHDRLRIIDLDGLWVPDLADRPASECGHEAFNHPSRRSCRSWNPDIDAFSALVVWLSLRALAADLSIWQVHHSHDDHLLITEQDLVDLDSDIWLRLETSPDDDVVQLTTRLRRLASGPVEAVPSVARALAQPTRVEGCSRRLSGCRTLGNRTRPGGTSGMFTGSPWWMDYLSA